MDNAFCQVLLEQGVAEAEPLQQASLMQKKSGSSIQQILIDQKIVTAEQVAKGLAAYHNIPYLAVDEDFLIATEEVRQIHESIARQYCLVPVKKDSNNTMWVAMKDPLDMDALDTVRATTGLEIRRVVSTEERILRTIDKFYTESAHIEQNLKSIVDLETQPDELEHDQDNIDASQLRIQANDAPVVRFVNLLLMQAVRDRASDIHFEPAEDAVQVRIRVDGVLREITPPPKHLYQAIVSRIKILSDMDIAERRLPLDGRFKFKLQNKSIDVRVSSLPEVYGEKLVLRVLDQGSLKVDLADIGLQEATLRKFQRTLKMPHGIILITGPTGSGKTTTLYSALNYAKTPERNIQTVEDPVEYQLAGINQMSIKERIGLDFSRCLRSILRQDPDVIMIGEMRDGETSSIAMRAALTGHLVLSTLHTNDATSAFSRLRDIGVEPYLIAATVNLVISQRLVRQICSECKIKKAPDPEQLAIVTSGYPEVANWEFYGGEGCEHCNGTGYHGRIAVLEFLEMSDALRTMILDGLGDTPIRAKALELGMQTLSENGLSKIKDGLTTIEEVLKIWPMTESETIRRAG
jgi:type IV pilus assembly protein PilB